MVSDYDKMIYKQTNKLTKPEKKLNAPISLKMSAINTAI